MRLVSENSCLHPPRITRGGVPSPCSRTWTPHPVDGGLFVEAFVFLVFQWRFYSFCPVIFINALLLLPHPL